MENNKTESVGDCESGSKQNILTSEDRWPSKKKQISSWLMSSIWIKQELQSS